MCQLLVKLLVSSLKKNQINGIKDIVLINQPFIENSYDKINYDTTFIIKIGINNYGYFSYGWCRICWKSSS